MNTTIAPVEAPAVTLPAEAARTVVAPSQAAADLDAMLDLISQGLWTRNYQTQARNDGRTNNCALGMIFRVTGRGY